MCDVVRFEVTGFDPVEMVIRFMHYDWRRFLDIDNYNLYDSWIQRFEALKIRSFEDSKLQRFKALLVVGNISRPPIEDKTRGMFLLLSQG